MRFRFVPLLTCCLVLLLLGCQGDGRPAKTGIAVVDMARIMRDSVPGKEGVKFLEGRQAALQADLDDIQSKVEKNPDDEKIVQELQQIFAVSQQHIQAEQQNVVNILFDAVQRVINEYRQKEGYDVILAMDAVASFNPQNDVTNAVIAEVDKLKLDFKPLPQARLPQKSGNADGTSEDGVESTQEKETGADADDAKKESSNVQPPENKSDKD